MFLSIPATPASFPELITDSGSSPVYLVITKGFYSNRPTAAVNLGFEGKGDYYLSDRFVENASFLRCDNITVGYSFKNLLKSQAYKGINGRIYWPVRHCTHSYSGWHGGQSLNPNFYK